MSYLRNHKVLLLVIGVLAIANIGLLYSFVSNRSDSHPKKMTPDEMHQQAMEKVRNEVGLNDQQVVLYDTLRSQQFRNMKPLFKAVTKSKEDFFSLIYQPTVTDSVINAYATKIGEKQMALDMSTFRYFQSIKELCNEEQKPKMDTLIKQMVNRIINNNGPRKPPPDRKENK